MGDVDIACGANKTFNLLYSALYAQQGYPYQNHGYSIFNGQSASELAHYEVGKKLTYVRQL